MFCYNYGISAPPYQNLNRSAVVRRPVWSLVYSAARTAPRANPSREWASWVIVMQSAGLSYM